ncbi:MAG: 3-phosphoshikimate 1-carboxyvinyltransferase [Candidatus Micrarchaeota archaeon]|nr:3-phosphoshikimate 1-carboxyvinyltransferase [Candidatus Micrarchaeota archaeon]MDE1804916.1 3-phosphoshikimate 1-carboxyvinyltransferase [Candidatus Micrarchaeota archaeon]MDE1846747.1 3-phosphoshikimate 1-carboxyvinyltransferase [Candidatus Micrarchaeota archaeon]
MIATVDKSVLGGIVVCPPSKSATHRAIFMAALARGESTILRPLISRDTLATINSCRNFGAEIEIEGNAVKVVGPEKFAVRIGNVNAENSGTTIRISAAVYSLFGRRVTLTGDASLRGRPMQPIIHALESLGVKCTAEGGRPPITISGTMGGRKVSIEGSVSSQFISGLMIAAPKSANGLEIMIKGNLVSKPYIDMTVGMMGKFGVEVEEVKRHKRYRIAPQSYKPSSVTVPNDFSSAALLLAAAVLVGKNLKVAASYDDLPQGDKRIVDILKKLGADVKMNSGISVRSAEELKGGSFDLSDTPDLLPPLSILALKSRRPIEIYGVAHARKKETDRIAVLANELRKVGMKTDEREDGLTISRGPTLNGAHLDAKEDHRLFMALCIAGMYVGNTTVTDPDSVDVSYPGFISDMQRAGAKIRLAQTKT